MEIFTSPELQAYLATWIPGYCCVTSNCCFEIFSNHLVDLGDMKHKIIASGQEIVANYSPDGKYWRCACEQVNGIYTKFLEAKTYCLFIPRLGF